MNPCRLQEHDLLVAHQHGERRVYGVLFLTLVVMVVEVVAGILFHSMALTADGWHMGTHAAAFGITLFAYHYARKHARDPRFSFGTGKVGALGAFASAVALGVVALLMAVESIHRLLNPQQIRFDEAIVVAVIGLVVNLVSAWLLKEHHVHAPGHDHDHHHHHDHNLKAAYFHVLADALTSVLAIVALLFGRMFGWVVLDPIMGVVGAVVITRWALSLLRQTSDLLLDASSNPDLVESIRCAIEGPGDCRICDLHVWAVAPGHHAVILEVECDVVDDPAQIKARLATMGTLSHITVEIIKSTVAVADEIPASAEA